MHQLTLEDLDRQTEPRNRHEQLQADFEEFHRKNPHVWEEFRRYALAAINAGEESWSARAILHVIRWDHRVRSRKDDMGFKVNDHVSPFYGRMFEREYPEHKGFFHKRIQTSRQEAPRDD